MTTVVLLGTLDTKGPEYAFLRQRVRAAGCDVIVVDAGVMSGTTGADVDADSVARAAGVDRGRLAAMRDRGPAVAAMTRGATAVVRRLHATGRLDGILGVGGSGGSSIVSAAMQALPLGVPKLLVSTMGSGDTRPYGGTADVTIMHSVVDLAGINRISERVLANAAAAIAAMATAAAGFSSDLPARPVVGATMYGNTTPAVMAARELLEARGYEVLVFHANGAGGRAMEALVREGAIDAVLDVTTTELADELVGGVCSAGPERLEAAGALGLPQVVSLGALDMVNFGPIDSVPSPFRTRNLYRHNAAVTLMRTTAAECAELGRILAGKLNEAIGPVTIFVPGGGLSMIGLAGRPFHDPVADAALIGALKADLRPDIEVVESAADINDPGFAQAMAGRPDELYWSRVEPRPAERREEVQGGRRITTAASAAS
ncbi:MAG TPA: Tm-1-like ATP-binding domain-containing protein [Candidatus Deferrimicrobiaceae bacterium]|nr:Tm-1-like ATP-binding domain-containing protein [Candidatus Deferrimicrobiaceae bacterium]